jgi:hypothetical protein
MRVIVVVALFAAACSSSSTGAPGGDLGTGDMATPPGPGADMTWQSPGDLAEPPPSDLAGSPPADLTPAPPDMTPSCGAVAGQMCCPVPLKLPECQHRDIVTGQIIGCDQASGLCVRCGSMDLPCCPGDECYGGTTCGKPGGSNPGICK